jgi:predicted regulator of Ras-like GTPase activity (Roadblock/LC7/MglB family)
VSTSFTAILTAAIANTPGAMAAIFADREGEAIDQVAREVALDDLLVMGAHYGVLLSQFAEALGRMNLGRPTEMLLQHERIDMLIQSVSEQYYVVLAIREGSHLGRAREVLYSCVQAIKAEM